MTLLPSLYRQVFLISLGAVQFLDALSTSLALTRPDVYEANKILSFVLVHRGNVPIWIMVFLYMILGYLIVLAGLDYLFGFEVADMASNLFVLFGFILLVVWRMMFIVIPNFWLYMR